MHWIIPSQIASTIGTIALVAIYFYLYVQYRERFMGIWVLSWVFYTLRLIFEISIALQGTSFLIIGSQTCSLISGMYLLWGTYLFREKRFPIGWTYCAAAGIAWIIVATLSRFSFPVITFPISFFLGIIYVWTGVEFLRLDQLAGAGKQITGWAFLIWGVHKANYPFLGTAGVIASWGYLTATLLALTVAVGIILLYFQKTRKNLIEREEQYESLFKNNHSIMLLIDPETADIIDANTAACSFYGFSKEQLTRKKIKDLNIISPRQASLELLKIRRDQSSHFTLRHRLASGEYRDVEAYSSPIKVSGRTLVYLIVHDVTDRKQTEDKLHATMSQLAALIDNMRDGILFEDKSRRIVLVNQTLCSILGIPVEPLALIGMDCRQAAQDASILFTDPREFLRRIDEIIRDGLIIVNEKLSLLDGRTFERDYIPIFIRNVYLGHLWQYRDVTERQKLQDQLRHSQKMEAIGTFAGGIAHDFNNILTAIIGYANLLKLGSGNGNPHDNPYIDQILASSERAAGLTQSLLAFSSSRNLSLRPLNLNNIVQRVEKLLHRVIGEDINLTAVISNENAMVMGDSGQLEQVLMMLATNARDAMPEGGHLGIEVSRVELDESFRRNHGYGKTGWYALMSVSDTGIGIDPKMRERIFEPFFTSKEMGRGAGLGLAMVYGIVKQHNGYINCYSEIGKGTTFKIYLPLADVKHLEDKPAESLPLPGGDEVILIAEDDVEVRKLTQAVLEEFGYTVITAEDGEDAGRKFQEQKDAIKLIIIDVIMPKKSGKEVYEDAKRMNPGIKTLFTSGYPLAIIQKRGILDSGMPFISKPISPKELLQKVREVLDQ